MVLDWIRVSGFTYVLSRGKMLLIMMPELKTFARSDSFIHGGQFEIADPFRRPSCWQRFCTCGSLKDKFNTFILKNKLIAKSVEGSLHNLKSQV
jgi:hypothetical protein